jgi:hypothetical protein
MVKMKGIEEGKRLFSVQCDRVAEMRYPPPEGLVGASAAVRSNWKSAVKLMQASKMLQNKAADSSKGMASARMREQTHPLMRKSGSKGSLSMRKDVREDDYMNNGVPQLPNAISSKRLQYVSTNNHNSNDVSQSVSHQYYQKSLNSYAKEQHVLGSDKVNKVKFGFINHKYKKNAG